MSAYRKHKIKKYSHYSGNTKSTKCPNEVAT